MAHVSLVCTFETFRPVDATGVRWLDYDADYGIAAAFWSQESPLTQTVWQEAHELGYCYCAVETEGMILAMAAVWRYSDEVWEAAAVRTAESFRRQGYGKRVLSFVTSDILTSGCVATCHTAADNAAMIRTALSVGYVQQLQEMERP